MGAHLIALVVYPLLLGRVVPVLPPAAPDPRDPVPEGMQVVAIFPTEEPDPDPGVTPPPDPREDVTPEPTPDPVRPGGPPPAEVDPEEERPRGPTVAERLRPRMGDPRLWAPLDPETVALSDEERAELLLRGMIQSWNDSVAVAAALSGRALDWTYTDDEGRRWGLSPGRLHLGDFSIPIPFSFQIPPSQREEWERRQWELEDLARGATSAAIRETWTERAREIRRRLEEERRQGGGGGR